MEVLQFFLAALVFIVFGLGMLLLGGIPIKRKYKLMKNGIETEAIVKDIDVVPTENGSAYRYILEYNAESGQKIIKGWDEYQHSLFKMSHPIGSSLIVYYDENEPQKYVVKSLSAIGPMQMLMMIVGICLILFSSVFIFQGLKTI